jgi:hypothetical protein
MTPADMWLEVYARLCRDDQQFVLPWEPTTDEALVAAISNPCSALAGPRPHLAA